MKAETVFNLAIHLTDDELKRLNKLIADRVNTKTTISKKSIKKPLITNQESRRIYLRKKFNKSSRIK